ncbi:MAG: alpha/beta fold hydrolase [Deltaproteobacteria bacterium]|nr:alpha/beta fold hydrolase [Deltaproteobacteria bacterium]
MSRAEAVYIHGWATDAWVWEATARLIGVDHINIALPGHGGKGAWDAPTLGPALAEIERAAPDGPLIGIGWSLGAQAVLASAIADPSKWKALILVGATPRFAAEEGFNHGQSKALVRRMIMDMKKDAASTLKRFYRLNFTQEELSTPEARRFFERYVYPGPMDCDAATPGCFPVFKYDEVTRALEALYSADLRGGLASIAAPTLVIHGAADAVTPVEAGRYLAENIKGAAFAPMDGAGHAPHLTRNKECVEVIKGFLKTL